MMSLTFGLFTLVRDSGPHGSLVLYVLVIPTVAHMLRYNDESLLTGGCLTAFCFRNIDAKQFKQI